MGRGREVVKLTGGPEQSSDQSQRQGCFPLGCAHRQVCGARGQVKQGAPHSGLHLLQALPGTNASDSRVKRSPPVTGRRCPCVAITGQLRSQPLCSSTKTRGFAFSLKHQAPTERKPSAKSKHLPWHQATLTQALMPSQAAVP